MDHTRLGRTGLPVSRLCLGTMTFGLQSDEPTAVAILDRAAEGGIDFLDTSDAYPLGGDLSTRGRHRGDHRPLAPGQAGPLHRGDQVLRADRAGTVRRGQFAQAHHVRRRGLTPAAADRLHRPVSAARVRPADADRRDARRPRRPGPPGQGPLRRLLELPDLSAGPRRRPERDAAAGPLRLSPAAVQPALPPDRAGDAAVLRRGRRRRHSVQPDRGRPAVGQALAHCAAARRAAGSLSAPPGGMYQERYWHDAEFDTVEQLRRAGRPRRA